MAPKRKSDRSALFNWFFTQPAKFSLFYSGLLVGIIFVLYMAWSMFNLDFYKYLFWPGLGLAAIAGIYSIIRLIQWLPKEDLTRRDFVAVDNGFTIIYYGFVMLSFALAIKHPDYLIYYKNLLLAKSAQLFFFTAVFVFLFYIYILGTIVSTMYATYRRAVTMGVNKWKALFSFPMGSVMFWMPGYFLNDEEKPNINIKSKWFSNFTNWIIAKPLNTILVVLVILTFSWFMRDKVSIYVTMGSAAVFGIWVWILGVKKFRGSIGGLYATVAVILNVLLVLYMTTSGTVDKYLKKQSVQNTTTEIIDTNKKGK